MEPIVGLEPTTYGLQIRCSTNCSYIGMYGGNVHDYATTKGVPCGHHTHMTFRAAMGVEPTQTFTAK